MDVRVCHLSGNLGGPLRCTGAACGFWEQDGCVIETLGLHRLNDAELTALLVQLRGELEAVRFAEERATSRGEFARRLGHDD